MSNINREQWLISRRHALRGLGAAIALPLLDCMVPTRAISAEPLSKPKRSVFLYVPNGVNTLTWQIGTAGSDYELPAPLQSLQKHREHITPISGLHHPNGIGLAHSCDKIWLTGAKVTEGRFPSRNTISADQRMAEVIGSQTPFPSLELAITGGTLAWSRSGVPLPSDRKPSVIFNRLFGSPRGSTREERQRLGRRRSILDLVLGDARRLRRTVGGEDRVKLDEYLDAVREVETRTKRADAWLEKPPPNVEARVEKRLTRNIPDTDAGDYYKTIYDLMVLALVTDRTRIITCMSGSESHALALPEIGIPQTRHELSHHNGDPEKMRQLTACDRFLTEHFSYFLDRLRSHRERGESLLDRTMVLFGSGMAYGHNHGNANLPTILAGGKALGLTHGRHLDYNLPKIGAYDVSDPKRHYAICLRPADSNARLSNLLLTMLQRMGVRIDRFGDSVGPISEILA